MLRNYANKSKKFSLSWAVLVGTVCAPFFGVNAAELNVLDKTGTPYLKVDAPEGTSFDLVVAFNSSDKTTAQKDQSNLILSQKGADNQEFPLTSESLKNGLTIPGVKIGEYQLTSNSPSIEIRRVDVATNSNSNRASLKSGDESLGPVAYTVGAAAVVGGVVALGSGSGNMDIFSRGSGNSSASTSRDGDINTASIDDVDPNRPSVPSTSNAPGAGVTTAPGIGTGTSGSNNVETPTGGNPTVVPPPPVTTPRTPS